MKIRSVIGISLLFLSGIPGCSPPTDVTAPAQEPNTGPGFAAGAAPPDFAKPGGSSKKADAKSGASTSKTAPAK